MHFEKEGNVLVAKLDHDQDVFSALETLMSKINENSATVISAIGMIKDFKLGFYDAESGEYIWDEFDEPMELLSLNGSITEDKDIHIHAQVADKEHNVKGGHLDKGTIHNVTELTMLLNDKLKMKREHDEERDMDLLKVDRYEF